MTRRILLVRGPAAGGIARHVDDLAATWRDAGDAVVVCAPDVRAGVDVTVPVPGAWSSLPRARRPLTDLVRGADLVHAHGLRAGLVTAAIARRSHVPVVVSVHNRVDATTSGRTWRLTRIAERGVAPLADVTVGASDDITQRLGRTARTIHVAAPARKPERTRDDVRTALGIDHDALVAVCVARLHPQKDLLTLIAAATRARARGEVRLVVLVAGDGDERRRLETAIAATDAPVRLLGTRDDTADLYAAADLAVLTSVWEAVPLALKEAAQAGLPLVATDTGGVSTLVRDGETGLLVPVGDADAVAEAFVRLGNDPDARHRLGAEAQRLEATAFSHAVMCTALQTAYADAETRARRRSHAAPARGHEHHAGATE